jgi:hypothetical protein
MKKLIKKKTDVPEEQSPPPVEEAADVATDADISQEEETDSEEFKRTLAEETGTLMLRFFSKDERTGKVLTRIHRKVFFPIDPNLVPGWYIATIVEIHDKYGVMDTMPLSEISPNMWKPQHIKGIFIERSHQENELHIYPAIPKSNLDEQKSVCVHKVKLPEPKYKKGATIGEILKAKQAEL